MVLDSPVSDAAWERRRFDNEQLVQLLKTTTVELLVSDSKLDPRVVQETGWEPEPTTEIPFPDNESGSDNANCPGGTKSVPPVALRLSKAA